jgi:nucleoredoxin
MTFGALPFEERQAKAKLAAHLQVRGIPALMIFGPRPVGGGDRPLINASLRGIIEQGAYLSDFPYHPKRFGDLNKTADNINALRCLIVFHEGGDDEEQEDIQKALQMASEQFEDKTMRFLWANAPTGPSKSVRGALQLGPIKENPVVVLLDIPDQGAYYISEKTDVSLPSVLAFLTDPGERRQL